MPILTDQLALFAMPKTASVWAERAMSRVGLHPRVPDRDNGQPSRHMVCADEARAMAGDRTKAAFVRHPFTWLRSVWLHLHAHRDQLVEGVEFFQGPVGGLTTCYAGTFGEFASNVVHRMPGAVTAIYEAYTSGVDVVRRVEDLPWTLGHLLQSVGHRFDWNRLARTAPANLSSPADRARCRWAQPSADELYAANRSMFERWGYGADLTRAWKAAPT